MLLPSEIFSHRHYYLCLTHARLPENFWWFVLVLGFGGLSCFLVHRRWPIYFCSLVSSLLLSNLSGRNEGECLLFVTRNSFYSLFIYSFKKIFLSVLGLHCCIGCCKLRLLSSCGAWASNLGGFSCCRAWALAPTGFSSCGTPALEQFQYLWHLGLAVL